MFRATIFISALLVLASATRLPRPAIDASSKSKPKPIEGIALEMGSGEDRKLLFPPSLQNRHRPEEIMLASKEQLEAVADDLSETYNAGLSSFLEISSHESFQEFGDTFMTKMEPYRRDAAKQLANQKDGMGHMFEDHMYFEVSEWEAKKAFKAFQEMDTNEDGKISNNEKIAFSTTV